MGPRTLRKTDGGRFKLVEECAATLIVSGLIALLFVIELGRHYAAGNYTWLLVPAAVAVTACALRIRRCLRQQKD